MEDIIQNTEQTDIKFMKEALRQAKKAYKLDETPIGCVIVHEGKIIARGYNRRNTDKSPLAHAEITAIRKEGKPEAGRLAAGRVHAVRDAGTLPDVRRGDRTVADPPGGDRLYESKGGMRRVCAESAAGGTL